MLALSQELQKSRIDFRFFFGANSFERAKFFISDEIASAFGQNHGPLIATEDGSLGERGSVLDLYRKNIDPSLRPERMFACGPAPMLRAVAEYASAQNIDCFVSMEEMMACGIGACLSCTCGHKYGEKRVCVEGPVFNSSEIRWE